MKATNCCIYGLGHSLWSAIGCQRMWLKQSSACIARVCQNKYNIQELMTRGFNLWKNNISNFRRKRQEVWFMRIHIPNCMNWLRAVFRNFSFRYSFVPLVRRCYSFRAKCLFKRHATNVRLSANYKKPELLARSEETVELQRVKRWINPTPRCLDTIFLLREKMLKIQSLASLPTCCRVTQRFKN